MKNQERKNELQVVRPIMKAEESTETTEIIRIEENKPQIEPGMLPARSVNGLPRGTFGWAIANQERSEGVMSKREISAAFDVLETFMYRHGGYNKGAFHVRFRPNTGFDTMHVFSGTFSHGAGYNQKTWLPQTSGEFMTFYEVCLYDGETAYEDRIYLSDNGALTMTVTSDYGMFVISLFMENFGKTSPYFGIGREFLIAVGEMLHLLRPTDEMLAESMEILSDKFVSSRSDRKTKAIVQEIFRSAAAVAPLLKAWMDHCRKHNVNITPYKRCTTCQHSFLECLANNKPLTYMAVVRAPEPIQSVRPSRKAAGMF